MKTSTLFVFALAAGLAFVTGCKTPPERVTQLGDVTRTREAVRTDPNLNTEPVTARPGGQDVTAVPTESALPDESGITGRDLDRAVFAPQTVYFEFDQANMKAGEASKLEQVAGAFKARGPGYDLLVEGHCDERGTEEYNRSLGERRALAIRELLMKSGVDGLHVYTHTLGKDKPAVVGHDEAAWSKNRRGEFILVLPRKISTTQNAQ